MADSHRKLLIGHHFIYTLRVMEYYLRRVAKNPARVQELAEASIAADLQARATGAHLNSFDYEWLALLTDPLVEHSGVLDGVVAPRESTGFSSEALGRMMGVRGPTLNQHLQIFSEKWGDYYAESLALLRGQAVDRRQLDALANARTRERMRAKPYRVSDAKVTPNLKHLVRSIVHDSGFFCGMNLLYYRFFRWHRIDYSHIRQVELEGVALEYRDDLMSILQILEERRFSFDALEVTGLLDEYFEYYARFISDPKVIEALDYSYHDCSKYNSPGETQRLFIDLWRVHRAFYTSSAQSPTHTGLTQSTRKARQDKVDMRRSPWLREHPTIPSAARITTHRGVSDDASPTAPATTAPAAPASPTPATPAPVTEASWEASFESAFPSVVERQGRTDAAMKQLAALSERSDTSFTRADFNNARLLLETANMIPQDTTRFNSSVYHYEAIDECLFTHFDGLRFAPPYLPLIDSSCDHIYTHEDLSFVTDSAHLTPELEVGPFKPFLQELYEESRLKAINAGYKGISEYKIYLYGVERDANGRFVLQAGKTDYFTGIARKDLFARCLVPSRGNLRVPLLYLLNHNALDSFVASKKAYALQERYNSPALRGEPPTARLAAALASDLSLESEIFEKLSYEINKLYKTLIADSCRKAADGSIRLFDNGATYTGCGTFILTSDTDAAGNDRPFLLLEKRWKVSEENDNLSYPSGASCDLYSPDDGIPQDLEELKVLEANPFKTAVRELREELNVMIDTRDLELVSFGIDVNRNLQQFSFLYESDQAARMIIERARYAPTAREGFTFFIPFERQAILDILNNYHIESGAVYSLMRIMELKHHRLW
ncbi:MAG: hypothetical protein LBU48_04355 [Coriobacteriales bacterium]|jgi:hypothetical protein|nr:hypothetical protein [Coriobacteriales bacterium]